MSKFNESKVGVPLNNYEITFEEELSGGINLDLMYAYYSLDKIIHLMKWN